VRFGWARFYADENVDQRLLSWLRRRGYRVDSAQDLGLIGRDDSFQLQEARRRKAVLLTNDVDYLNHRRFPFTQLRDTAIVIMRTEEKGEGRVDFGYMLLALDKEIGASHRSGLNGLKIEVRGPRMILHARVRSRIRTDEINISRPWKTRRLFQQSD
jgi:predicted nuclease of predicted toxin-antitoxin system